MHSSQSGQNSSFILSQNSFKFTSSPVGFKLQFQKNFRSIFYVKKLTANKLPQERTRNRPNNLSQYAEDSAICFSRFAASEKWLRSYQKDDDIFSASDIIT